MQPGPTKPPDRARLESDINAFVAASHPHLAATPGAAVAINWGQFVTNLIQNLPAVLAVLGPLLSGQGRPAPAAASSPGPATGP